MERSDLTFWTDILSDHAMFQINAFSSKEEKYIYEAKKYHSIYKRYSQQGISGENINIQQLEDDVIKFISFKKKIILELLNCNIAINFSPCFINHMVNEALEFLNLFHMERCPEATQNPPLYIKLWMADASGHASTLMGFLDLSETMLIHQAELYKIKFDKLFKKASELEMLQNNMQIKIKTDLLAYESIEALEKFILLCNDIGKLSDCCQVLSVGTFNSTITNHFIKEHNYFINKIKEWGCCKTSALRTEKASQ